MQDFSLICSSKRNIPAYCRTMSTHIQIPLVEGEFYHIYNRGNDGINLFYQTRNYSYFLNKYDYYLSGYIHTYAYCLLPNHFHFLVKIGNKKDFVARKNDFPQQTDLDKMSTEEIISELFRRFFMSYSKSINVQEKRSGSLFQKNFRRRLVNNESYFSTLVYYIHRQLKYHGFKHMDDRDYPWSSYQRFLLDRESRLKKKEVMSWFGGKEEFISFHAESRDLSDIEGLTIEEEGWERLDFPSL